MSVDNAESIPAPELGAQFFRSRLYFWIKKSKHPDGISGPLNIRLSNPQRIWAWPNTAEVNIDPQAGNVIMQIRDPCRAQKLVARVSEQPDIVGSFFAPNRKIKNQVLSGSRNLQRCLASLRWVLPASH